jgi:hypothetical protein
MVFAHVYCRIGSAFHTESALIDIPQDGFAVKSVNTDIGSTGIPGSPLIFLE